VIKWLWRLADDESCSFEVPPDQRVLLLAALKGVSSTEEPQVG
jgi:hypothetical protein